MSKHTCTVLDVYRKNEETIPCFLRTCCRRCDNRIDIKALFCSPCGGPIKRQEVKFKLGATLRVLEDSQVRALTVNFVHHADAIFGCASALLGSFAEDWLQGRAQSSTEYNKAFTAAVLGKRFVFTCPRARGFAVSMVPEAGRAFATVAAVLSAAETRFSVSPGLSALTQRAVETSVMSASASAAASGSTATDTVFSMGGLLQALNDGDAEPLTPRLVDLSVDDPLTGASYTRAASPSGSPVLVGASQDSDSAVARRLDFN